MVDVSFSEKTTQRASGVSDPTKIMSAPPSPYRILAMIFCCIELGWPRRTRPNNIIF